MFFHALSMFPTSSDMVIPFPQQLLTEARFSSATLNHSFFPFSAVENCVGSFNSFVHSILKTQLRSEHFSCTGILRIQS